MRFEAGYYIWNKGDVAEKIGQFFTTNEMTCKCSNPGCVEQRASKELMDLLDWLRGIAGHPIEINSGFRCAAHQKEIEESGISTVVAKVSAHEAGMAADIRCPSLRIDELLQYVDMKCNNVGVALNYIHIDVRPLKPDGTKRRWYYYNPVTNK